MQIRWLALTLLASALAEAAPKIIDVEGLTQGTSYHLRYVGPEKVDFKFKLDEQLLAFDKIFSNYRPDSEISRFNALKSSDWFPVNPKLVYLIELSHRVSLASKGAFDITIGDLMRVWGFGPFKQKNQNIPSGADIVAARKNVDFKKLIFRKNPPALKKLNAQLNVDLSGVAQGYSLDEIAIFIENSGIKNYLLEIGGEIKTCGQKPSGTDWEIEIESPSSEPDAFPVTIHAQGKSLTTSGDYRDYFEKNGKRYSHTIDPRSGQPIEHQLASVSVIMNSAAQADAWDTALMVLGPDAGRALAQENQIASFLIKRQGTSFSSESIAGFAHYLVK